MKKDKICRGCGDKCYGRHCKKCYYNKHGTGSVSRGINRKKVLKKNEEENKMEKEYQGDFMQFDCTKCYHTNRVTIKNGEKDNYFCSYCGEKLNNQEEELEIINEFNVFIKKWCAGNYSHLIDSDENDGEKFREKLRILCGGKIK